MFGLASGVRSGDDVADATEPDRPLLARNCGDAEPFCFVRFICMHRSGLSRWNIS
jgi:hypothetical protein